MTLLQVAPHYFSAGPVSGTVGSKTSAGCGVYQYVEQAAQALRMARLDAPDIYGTRLFR